MHRSTLSNTTHRAYSAGGARTIIDKVDDGPQMQTMSGNFMKGESRKDVESPQNYGFTSLVMPADKGKDGQIEESAEGFVSFMGGNRSFPVCQVMDDRRHRLKSGEKDADKMSPGDSAMYRTKDDRQQFHLNKDGNFLSVRDDRINRFALVPKPQGDQQQQQGSQQSTGGGGGEQGSGQQAQEGQKKKRGQTHALADNKKSQISIEQNGKESHSRHGEYYAAQRGDSDVSNYYQDRKISHQNTDKHSHMRYKEHRLWNEEDGNYWTSPCLLKKDLLCKD